MKILTALSVCSAMLVFASCGDKGTVSSETSTTTDSTQKNDYAGFGSAEKWGEHIVHTSGCHDCHTPKKMTDHGPDMDWDHMLSGHPAAAPDPQVNRKEMEGKGLAVTGDLTSWVGPWGISYTANLTPDSTGLLAWKEEQFIYALRNGITKGIQGSRPMLPPMPWSEYKNFTDNELKAIFAYLKSIKPISNLVPAPKPPVSAPPKH